jgi:hypothetical protein
MQTAPVNIRQRLMGSTLLGLICLLVFFIALFAVPAISESSGIASKYVSYALAGLAFIVAIVATRCANALNKKKPAEGKSNA